MKFRGDKTFSDVLRAPADFKKIMQEAKNEERVEASEQEKRSKNLIIHGLKETGEGNDAIKANDTNTITRFLEKIGIGAHRFTRLGKPIESKQRTLRITMKTKQDKDSVMANLKRLRGTEEEFGKISVTEDYTSVERDLIRSWVKDAEVKSLNDPEKIYRVRGDPKNGLRLVFFTRQKISSS